MVKTTTFIAAAAIAAAGASAPALADTSGLSPIGIWAAENQKSRYQFSYCGDGTDLCATVIWMAPGKNDKPPKFASELGKMLLDTAKPSGDLTWSGKIRVQGKEADGTVQMVAPDRLHIKACQMLLICAEVDLVPPATQ